MTTIDVIETSDQYEFRILSSSEENTNVKRKEVQNRGSLKTYTAIGIEREDFRSILKRERKILKCLAKCPFITRLRCTIYNGSEKQGWVVYDSFTEPQWNSIIPSLSIDDIKNYVYQILRGIEFCHERRIVHRNISWSSLYFDSTHNLIQIGGWNYALFCDDIHPMEKDVEEPYFKSPERLFDEMPSHSKLKYEFPVDMWSVGCVLGCFIFRKKYMFDCVDAPTTVQNIVKISGSKAVLDFINKYEVNCELPSCRGDDNRSAITFKSMIIEGNEEVATDEAIDLLENLLTIDPADRYSVESALQHHFFVGCNVSDDYLRRRRKPTSIFKVKVGVNIGNGGFGRVYRIYETRKTGNQEVVRKLALKYINFKFNSDYERRAMNEVKAMQLLRGCPNIIQIHGVLYESPGKGIYILMEYLEALTDPAFLFTRLDDVKFYLYKLLVALEACHSRKIMHRDVKPANILINYVTKQLRLIDFGLAEFYEEGRSYNLNVGTPGYIAPEILLDYPYYHYAVDMWAFGVILASCIFKRRMIDTRNGSNIASVTALLGTSNLYEFAISIVKDITLKSLIGSSKLLAQSWQSFINDANRDFATDDAIDLIDKLLVYNHNERLNVHRAMEHPFFLPCRRNN